MTDAVARRGLSRALAKWRPQRRQVGVCAMIFAGLIVVSCKYTANQRPPIDALEGKLKIGASTQQEVIAMLGQPNGNGGSFLPIDEKSRKTLSYYFEEGTVNSDSGRVAITANRVFLWVYIDQDRYDGYMWFTTTISGQAH